MKPGKSPGASGPCRLVTRRHRRGPLRRKAWPLAVLGAALAAAAAIFLIRYIHQTGQTRAEQEALRALYQNTPAAGEEASAAPSASPLPAVLSSSPLPGASPAPEGRPVMAERFLPLMRRNRDVVGWLSYPGIAEMDFPVVQRDNVWYLHRDFSGRDSMAGTVFMDGANRIWPQDDNLILHGHNMKNGTMFGKLARMLEPDMARRWPFLRFDTLYAGALYVPYAVTVFSNNPGDPRYIPIIAANFSAPEEKMAYVNSLRVRSSLSFPGDVREDDRLLTLITCHGPIDTERLAVALRALRPGEDQEALKQAFLAQVTKR